MKNRNKNIDAELAALAGMRDEDIDTSDIPEVRDWSNAVVGKFYRPVKEAVSLRIDADVLAWFRTDGPGYQTRINETLRATMKASRSATTARGSNQTAPQQAASGSAEGRCRTFHFPSLEKHGQIQRCAQIAGAIEERRSLFAPAQ